MGQPSECRVKIRYFTDLVIGFEAEVRSDVLSMIHTPEFPSNPLNDYNQSATLLRPGNWGIVLSLTSSGTSGRTKVTKSEWG